MLPYIVNELTKSQIDQINKVSQTGGRLVLKPTRKQIEGGLLGTLASIGIPMAISLVSKMFGGGLLVDKALSTKKGAMFMYLKMDKVICIHFTLHLFMEIGIIQLEWERKLEKVKKKTLGKGLLLGKNSPFNSIPILGDIL